MSTLKDALNKRIASFGYAFEGIAFALRTQPNTWIHALITAAVLVVGVWLRLPLAHWAILAVVAGLVWSAEVMNTAVEALVDLASPEEHPLAKAAKDAAAGAVLLAAISAVVTGLLILGPPLVAKVLG
jgi:diacylglycerol kinase